MMKLIVGNPDYKICNGDGVIKTILDKKYPEPIHELCKCAYLVDIPGIVEPEKERVFTGGWKVIDPPDNPELKEVLK